jgi:hypothetical protein
MAGRVMEFYMPWAPLLRFDAVLASGHDLLQIYGGALVAANDG